jgi:hypothetical protein
MVNFDVVTASKSLQPSDPVTGWIRIIFRVPTLSILQSFSFQFVASQFSPSDKGLIMLLMITIIIVMCLCKILLYYKICGQAIILFLVIIIACGKPVNPQMQPILKRRARSVMMVVLVIAMVMSPVMCV